eukprot:gb/GECH01011282.1/.p1 GENE.gb/GECH01011282.1/~~gb/GECH01011282.1/.p1  ORF type:complete len:281 (+),score=92.83 gb/GECH01011282.1/:1-843(+)
MGQTYHQLNEDEDANANVGRVNNTTPSSQPQQQTPPRSTPHELIYPSQQQLQQPQQPPQQQQQSSQPPQFVPHHLPPHFRSHLQQPQQQQQQQYQPSHFTQTQQQQQEEEGEDTNQESGQQPQQQQQFSTPNFPSEIQNVWIQPNTVEPILPALLTLFVFPGLGQILVGQSRKGVWLTVISLIMGLIIGLLCMVYIGLLLIIVPFVWSILVSVDAYRIAQRIRDGYPVQHGECTNSVTKIGLNWFMNDPVFNNSVSSECPAEWVAAIQQVDQARMARNQV